MRRLFVAFVALAVLACATEAVDPEQAARDAEAIRLFATPLAAPETGVVEHRAVPADSTERQLIQLERTVLVSPDPGRPETLFYRGLHLAVGPQHNLYVLENIGSRLLAFDGRGRFLRSIGEGVGLGPGQLGRTSGRVGVSDRYIHYLSAPNRLVTWTLDGSHVSTQQLETRTTRFVSMGVTADGLIAATWRKRQPDANSTTAVGTVAEDGLISELMVRAVHPRRGPVQAPQIALAVSSDAVGYLTSSDRYEVLAINLETGEQLWWLRVDWPAIELTTTHRSDIEAAEAARRAADDNPGGGPRSSVRPELDLPSRYPILSIDPSSWEWSGALDPVKVDGHGRLFVFPYVVDPEHGAPYPVDVYDRNGAFIGAGLMPRIPWFAARDDFVYGLEANEDEERVLVRYRIELPF